MKKYFSFLKIGFLVSLVYRTDNILWGISETIYSLVFIFIWIVLFNDKQAIAGFNLSETITYMIGVGLINGITSTGVARQVEQDIKKGTLSVYLIQPVKYIPVRIINNLTEDWISILMRLIQMIGLALFFSNFFIVNLKLSSLLLFAVSVLLAFIIVQLSFVLFGLIAFWTTSAQGAISLLRVIGEVFSGNMGPITFFPKWFQAIAGILPFYYVGFWPMLIYLDKVSRIKALEGLAIQLLWTIALMLLANFIWKKGTKKYEGVGI